MPGLENAEGRPLVGDVIAGKYRIESVAGEGGMGIVYEAEHVILRQRVAVKALLPGAVPPAEAIERFSLEASAIARIASEHVVRVMDAGSLPSGAPYLVMEYLDGCDLEVLLAQHGRMQPTVVVDFALQALEALAHAHAARVIHRDLKPANLFLAYCPDGRQIIKLVDFGISKSFDVSSDEDRIVGSPTYMSPEQLRRAPLDPRTDLWSLGVVLYELLSGAPPFVGTFSEMISGILGQDAVPLVEKVPGIPPVLSQIVATCLKREPDDRWNTTADLARALAPYGSGTWRGLIPRIDRVLSRSAPQRRARRFESFDNALQDLETGEHDIDTVPPPESQQVSVPGASNETRVRTAREGVSPTLPAPPSEPRVVVKHSDAMPGSSKPSLRILLIDDSSLALQLHERALSANGFDVRTTTSPSEFEKLVESFEPHLVLMDVQMPNTSGDELCRRVKVRFGHSMPVVLVSELPTDELEQRTARARADAFFRKTSDMDAFLAFVRNICAMTYSPEDLP